MIEIRCKNNKKTQKFPKGTSLSEIFQTFGLEMEYGPISAKVNNKVEGLHYTCYHDKTVEFLALPDPSAMRCYTRSLFMVLCKAVKDLFPNGSAVIDIPVSNGYFCDLKIGRPVSSFDVDKLRNRMQEIIDAAIPFTRHEATTEEAIELFRGLGANSKIRLMETLGQMYTTYYDLDGYVDYFYGTLMSNTSQLYLFGLEKYYDGVLLRIPSTKNPAELGEMIRQDKMFEIFQEHHRWQDILGIGTVGAMNEVVAKGGSTMLINVSEALQEKKISRIAEDIASREGVRMVLIAGPSSSGKTTFCKRLSIQLVTCGIKPVMMSLDDYFVDRTQTPRDEKGDYDYENLYALNIPLLNEHLQKLFEGEKVQLPRYDFQTGRSERDGHILQLGDKDVLVVEGIHALNPELTAQIPAKLKYKVYASALTTILLDTHNYIPTTDNRLLRRIIRDYKYRGCSARDTIRRWPSVRAGENKWIFPYQENSDAMFNTAMLFELAVIRGQAIPILEEVPENCPEFAEAFRLLKFLKYIKPIADNEIPPTSLLREFLGGSSFVY
ncbi:MAG: nucleoside kinase [Prevotella sp.]|nr:nucleoside kinase [Prevotella sp.]